MINFLKEDPTTYEETPAVRKKDVFKVEVENIKNEIQQVAVKEQLKETFKSTKSPDLDYVKNTFSSRSKIA